LKIKLQSNVRAEELTPIRLSDKERDYVSWLRPSALFMEDSLERIRHLQPEVNASVKEMEEIEKEHTDTEEHLRKLMKEFGVID